MDPRPHTDTDLELVDERLRASRPAPDPTFVYRLEQRLFPLRHERESIPLRFAAPAAALGLAGLALLFGLAGSGPLGLDGDDSPRAEPQCRFVTVTRRERVPVIARSREGEVTIRYRHERVRRAVRRCR
jgi:hypothetical protein